MSQVQQSLLIVDDDAANLASLARIFEREGLEVLTASDGKAALEVLRSRPVQVVLSDLMMPQLNGIELLRAIRAVSPDTEVILMTAFGTVETAVEAMKEGAWDFVTKPFKRIQIVRAIKRALDQQSLKAENLALRAELQGVRRESSIIGASAPIRQLLDLVAQVAPSHATVLLEGESGTGKELIARAIHNASSRATKPFIALNCAALPESLLEAELFGHEKGSFTGANARRQGRFELAHQGTLFLDELAEMSPQTQVKLLRVLQNGEFERVGGTQTIRVDTRIVAATNRDLKADVAAGRFREDLYYRLNVITLNLPPLRDRKEDIPLLAQYFISRYATKNKKAITGLTRDALAALMAWRWPGNVRELENAMERAVVLCRQDTIGLDDLPPALHEPEPERRELIIQLGTPLEEVERRLIQETLTAVKGDKRLAAQLLGIATRTIYRKL